jgi:hypothetical protein
MLLPGTKESAIAVSLAAAPDSAIRGPSARPTASRAPPATGATAAASASRGPSRPERRILPPASALGAERNVKEQRQGTRE